MSNWPVVPEALPPQILPPLSSCLNAPLFPPIYKLLISYCVVKVHNTHRESKFDLCYSVCGHHFPIVWASYHVWCHKKSREKKEQGWLLIPGMRNRAADWLLLWQCCVNRALHTTGCWIKPHAIADITAMFKDHPTCAHEFRLESGLMASAAGCNGAAPATSNNDSLGFIAGLISQI